jgi:hypothetical protein
MEAFALDPHRIVSRLHETKEFIDLFPKALVDRKRRSIIELVLNMAKGVDMEVGHSYPLEVRRNDAGPTRRDHRH